MYANDLINRANYAWQNNQQSWLPSYNTTPILPIKIQLVLMGVYFHRSSTLYAAVKNPPGPLNGLVGVNVGTEINTYLYNLNTADSLKVQGSACSYGGLCSSGGKGFWEKGANMVYKYWDFEGALNVTANTYLHELGHELSLKHTHEAENDLCWDTPIEPDCWQFDANNPICDQWTEIGNNLMGYHAWFPSALTPCQIGRMHTNIADIVTNPYIHSCNGCLPANAFFDILEQPCGYISDNHIPIWVEASASFAETEYIITTHQVTGNGSNTIVAGTQKTSGWLTAQAGKMNLHQALNYSYRPNKWYRITLSVRSACTPNSTQVKWVRVYDKAQFCAPTFQMRTTPEQDIQTIPNPNNGRFEINWGDHAPIRADLYDTQGRFVQALCDQQESCLNHIDLPNAPSGVYLLHVTTADGAFVHRFVITR